MSKIYNKKNLIITAFLFLLPIAFLSDYRRAPGAEYIRYLGAETLLLKGSLILDDYPPENLGVDKAKYNNHWFSSKSLGDHLIQVPARAFFSFVHSENTRFLLARIFSTMLIAALALAFIKAHYGFFIALIIFLGTPVWHEVRFTHSDLVSGALALAAILLLKEQKLKMSSFLFGLSFLVRYQLALFIAPFVFIYGVRKLRKDPKKLFSFWVFPLGSVFLQLLINYYYFDHPFNFNLEFWAPEFPEAYENMSTVYADNPVLVWSLNTFLDFWYLQWERPEMTMIKWMPWFYPGLIFVWLKKYEFRLEYLAGIFVFHLYLLGVPFWGFRYFGSLCFLSLPVILCLPRVVQVFILIFGIIVVNGFGEYEFIKSGEHISLLASKFGVHPLLSLLPSIFFLGVLIYRENKIKIMSINS